MTQKMSSDMAVYVARNRDVARKHGKSVLAAPLSRNEFRDRFNGGKDSAQVDESQAPLAHPDTGYIVVRKLNTPDQYVMWMPAEVFARHYRPVHGLDLACRNRSNRASRPAGRTMMQG